MGFNMWKSLIKGARLAKILSLIIVFSVFNNVTYASDDGIKASGVYAVCHTKQVNQYTADRACHQYYTKKDAWCSDPKGKVCTTTTREDLCIKTGKAAKPQVPLLYWSSGLGTFKSREACLAACNSKTVVNFGGKCHGVLLEK